jgi:hypothetical protein
LRRFEFGLGPLLARLGYTRPDEDPLQSADVVHPTVGLGAFPFSVPHPGGRLQSVTCEVPANPAGFSTAFFGPPPGGCWVHALLAKTNGGSFARIGTSNVNLDPVIVAPWA